MNGVFTRRVFFAFFASVAGGVVIRGTPLHAMSKMKPNISNLDSLSSSDRRTVTIRKLLLARVGEEAYVSWFKLIEFEGFDGRTVTVSTPVKFIRNWIRQHFSDDLLSCCRHACSGADSVDVVWRRSGTTMIRS
jgi:hypothetical protein